MKRSYMRIIKDKEAMEAVRILIEKGYDISDITDLYTSVLVEKEYYRGFKEKVEESKRCKG